MQKTRHQGFTLIELSIVLVVIGLIVGGVLMGQDLIHAANVRGTITQIERYNTAANTFREKYGYLPGDIKDPDASSFGFAARGPYAGEGDGNGVIEGRNINNAGGHTYGLYEDGGETVMFWVDLSAAHLIEGSFTSASPTNLPTLTLASSPGISDFFPAAKIGRGNYFYVWSGGTDASVNGSNGVNYFGLSAMTSAAPATVPFSTTGLTVQEAYNIDSKIDDGLPQWGRVQAQYLNQAISAGGAPYAAGPGRGPDSGAPTYGPTTAATAGSSTTCYDNSAASSGTPGVAGTTQHYSVEISNGSNVNCALSFRFQ